MTDYDLGKVVGDKGYDGSTIWNTLTAPTYANSKYTFTISNLTGKTGFEIAINDLIFYDTYYYIVSTVNSTTVDCTTRVNIKGSDASVTIVDNLNSTSSTSVLSAKQGKVLNDNKLDISQTSYKGKNVVVDNTTGNIAFEDKPTIPSASNTPPSADTTNGSVGTGTTWARSNHTHPKSSLYAESSHTHTKSQITDFPSLSTVATSGSYSDLSNKPSIPSSSSDLSDGSDLVKKSSTTGLIKNDGSIDTSTYLTSSALTNYVQKSNTSGLLKNDGLVDTNSYLTTGTASSTYQTKLVSGTSIKTINNESLLGSGNITIQGSSSVDIVTAWESTPSDSKVASEKLVKDSLDDLEDLIGDAITYINQ